MGVHLGSAKLQKSDDIFVYFYNLESIYNEFNKLNNQFDAISNNYVNNTIYIKKLNNYERIIKYCQQQIQKSRYY